MTSVSGDPPPRPAVIVFDVNQTLSDMGPMAQRFEDVGAPTHLAEVWFAEVLRDGFALTAAGGTASFADIGGELLRDMLADRRLDRDLGEAVEHVLAGFGRLDVHDDVRSGLPALAALGIRIVTLSNGSASVAEGLLGRSGLDGEVEAVYSVEDAGAWKPSPTAYRYALDRCGVPAGDAMLVAVHPWDVDGAARVGLRTAWVDRSGRRTYPAHFSAPEVRAASLDELAARLG